MKKATYFLFAFLLLAAACNQNEKKGDQNTVYNGKWQIEDIETGDESMAALGLLLYATELQPAYLEIGSGDIKLLDVNGKVLDAAKLKSGEDGEMEIYENGELQARCRMKISGGGRAVLSCDETSYLLARQ